MLTTRLGPSGDLAPWAVWLAAGLALASFVMLLFEMRRRERGGVLIAVTGLVAVMALLAAVLRPARVSARESVVGARVVVLADASRSMALDQPGGPRWKARDAAIEALAKAATSARLSVLGFGDGPPTPMPLTLSDRAAEQQTTREPHSDLGAAMRALAASPEERPAAVIVVSDGRLDDPPEDASPASLEALGQALHVPIDAVATTREAPPDASVRRVSTAGAAVAHVPLPLRVEVGCAGGVPCDELTVTARELRDDGPPSLLASGVAHPKDGKASIDLTVTLERAGARIVEVAIAPPPGDTIPANDRRLVTFDVARERVRVLHVAGRPTNDVRALRRWLKSDSSVDVVAFFILRTATDDAHATQNELALIPFPVDELFTEHLPSFDAIVLQDFDAQPYGLEKYLENIRHYVRSGGGLVMVGGQNSFVAGGYAGTPLAEVLPVALDGSPRATSAD
ncbi:MAG: VWA domain-containing protein, partial [Polyangiaceae bacterium]